VAAIKVLDVARVGAVLTQMHAPRVIYVPVMVVVRFFPMAVRELRAIIQAMTLRGLKPGAWSAMRHPMRTGEYVVIPFLASAARIADELSAAAIIKGLGAQKTRSNTQPSHFGIGDAVVLTVLAALVTWRAGEVIA
jgi:energy-coupling factor transporter transmembrane protein EcfT